MSLAPSRLTPRCSAADGLVTLRYKEGGKWFRWGRFPLSEIHEQQSKCLGVIAYVEDFAVTGAVWGRLHHERQSKLLRWPANDPAPRHRTPPPSGACA